MTDIITKLIKTMIVFAAYLYVNTTAYAVQITNNNPWPPASFVDSTNTRLPIELKSMPSNSYKLAATHFLGSEMDLSFSKKDVIDDNNVNDGAKRCAGYSVIGTDCRAKGASWIPSIRCPYHSNYYKLCQDCSSYTLDTQPENATFSKCENGKYKIDSCNTGYKLEGSSCVYGCSDYPLTSKPANAATCANCPYDSSKMKLANCNTGYTVSGNTCQCVPSTPNGYQSINNCDFGLDGTTTDHCGQTYYKCKACSDECTSGYEKTCPSGQTFVAANDKLTECGTVCHKCAPANCQSSLEAAGYTVNKDIGDTVVIYGWQRFNTLNAKTYIAAETMKDRFPLCDFSSGSRIETTRTSITSDVTFDGVTYYNYGAVMAINANVSIKGEARIMVNTVQINSSGTVNIYGLTNQSAILNVTGGTLNIKNGATFRTGSLDTVTSGNVNIEAGGIYRPEHALDIKGGKVSLLGNSSNRATLLVKIVQVNGGTLYSNYGIFKAYGSDPVLVKYGGSMSKSNTIYDGSFRCDRCSW